MAQWPPLLPAASLRWGPGGHVPDAFVDADAAQEPALASFKFVGTQTGKVCGPALVIAWRAFYFMIGLWFAAPVVTAWTSQCEVGSTLAVIPAWLFPVLSIGVMVELIFEHQVRKYVIVVISQWLAVDSPLTVMGVPVPFYVWVAFNTAVSCGVHADIITSGVTVGRTLKQCSPELDVVWEHLMRNSAVGKLLHHLPFWSLALTGWLFMTLQWITALYQAKPLTGTDQVGEELIYKVGSTQSYKARDGNTIGHADALAVLMDTTRMASIAGPTCKVNMELGKVMPFAVPDQFRMMMQRSVYKFAVVNVLENAFMLNVQAALLGVNRAVSGSIDRAIVASILLGMLTGIKNLASQWQYVHQLKAGIDEINIELELRKHMAEGPLQSLEPGPQKEQVLDQFMECVLLGRWDNDEVWEVVQERPIIKQTGMTRDSDGGVSVSVFEGKKSKQKAPRLRAFFLCFAGLYFTLAARAVWVTVMVTMVCSTGLYDFGEGCLELPSSNETSH